MDEREAAQTRAMAAMKDAALVILLDRAGGTFSYTEAEYQSVLARFGGKTRMNMRVEVTKPSAGGAPSVELRLETKEPRNAELMA
jgi:hypothetical protein